MTPLLDSQRVAGLARRQHGNISLDQLRRFIADDEIRARREAGWLIPRHREVYAVGHVPWTRLSTYD